MSIRILLLGSGGREHALAWKLSHSSSVDHVYVCPGNGGTATTAKCSNLDLSADDFTHLVDFAVKNNVCIQILLFLRVAHLHLDTSRRSRSRTTSCRWRRVLLPQRFA